MEAILDFSKPVDPRLVDEVITAFYTPGHPLVVHS